MRERFVCYLYKPANKFIRQNVCLIHGFIERDIIIFIAYNKIELFGDKRLAFYRFDCNGKERREFLYVNTILIPNAL